MTGTYYELYNQNTELSMWRPLYSYGTGSRPTLNEGESIAYPPVWSNHDTTVTIKLKPFRWSDGRPVTTRDVEFWWDLYRANKSSIGTYVPGDIPDNVSRIDWLSSSEFVMHLTQAFSPLWYDSNELSVIVPLPQHSWDRETLAGPVGSYDLTAAGAKKVFTFLTGQSSQLSTYATNPLWKVVDGPWVLTGYNPTTYETTLSRNVHYSGPDKPHLDQVIYVTETSDTAEVDALRSGLVDYGWLPSSDYGLAAYFDQHGYTVKPWVTEVANFAEFGYTGPYKDLVSQLYIRQALEHLVNQQLYMRSEHGLGQYSYGPVADLPGSPYVSPQLRHSPYPYSVSDARQLLTGHGWRPGPGGVLVCARPGTAPDDCGAGIAGGTALSMTMVFDTGYPTLLAQVEAFQTAAAQAGVQIKLHPETETAMFSDAGVCPPGPCNWGLAIYAYDMWGFGPNEALPTGGEIFGKGNYWGGGYYSPVAQQLIDLTHTRSGVQYLYKYENYLADQVAGLWWPSQDLRISVVKNTLKGWQQQSPFADPHPSSWYYVTPK